MKILSLHFKNLNSLYGEWKIDFTHPEYTQSGIFALTGPTGAGKSTLLDAICLALYGETPRLKNITKSTNEIMSRQTGECFSEISFLTQGETYTCRWEQRRAKKKYDGALQNPSYELSITETGEVLSTSRSGVLALVEEKTGMNYDRFTRTILLAQGNFNAFLKARVEEKSSILEEITGTEIYSEISIHVHDTLRIKKEELALLRAQTAHIKLLSDEEILQKKEELNKLAEEENTVLKEKSTLQQQKDWLITIDTLLQEIKMLKGKRKQLDQEVIDFTPQKEKLDKGKKARELEPLYLEFLRLQQEQKQDIKQVSVLEKEEVDIVKNLQKSTENVQKSMENIFKVKADIEKNNPVFQAVRLLDQSILLQKENLEKARLQLKTEREIVVKYEKKQKKEKKKQEEIVQNLETYEKWQKENIHDKILISEFSALNEQLKVLANKQQEGKQERLIEQEAKKKLVKQEKILTELLKQVEEENKNLQKLKEHIKVENLQLTQLLENKLLREYQVEKETLLREKSFVSRIVSLEKERKNLLDNTACPLCGALEHPYALGNIPQLTPIEEKITALSKRIEAILNAEKSLALLHTKEQTLILEHVKTQNLMENAKKDKEKMHAEHLQLLENIEKSIKKYQEQNALILETLRPLSIESIPSTDITSLQEQLKSRLEKWLASEKKKVEFEKLSQECTLSVKTTEVLIHSHVQQISEQEKLLLGEEEKTCASQKERIKLFADKNPDEEENTLQKSLQNIEKETLLLKEQQDTHKSALEVLCTRLKIIREQLVKRDPLLKSKESDFTQALMNKDFENIAEYEKARLSTKEHDQMEKKLEKLKDREKELAINSKDRDEKLQQELQKNLIPLEVSAENVLTENLSVVLGTYKENVEKKIASVVLLEKECSQNILIIQRSIQQNEEEKQKVTQSQVHINAQEKEVARFESLHNLIGSADGKRYRNFAQGLTFELMISHANRQLAKMSDRYLLQHDKNFPLLLNVIDDYQGGEIRSTANLSGGESFIVSLALALGLSQMVSQKVCVDSLFLDEGFGTLDEDALEIALETLASLVNYTGFQKNILGYGTENRVLEEAHVHNSNEAKNQINKEKTAKSICYQEKGKLIGIISHISALKDRIPVQIQLVPESGGQSVLKGAGCTFIGK